MIIAVYVDDIILIGEDIKEINFLKTHLDKVFTIKDLGDLHFFLGIEVSYQEDRIVLTQQKFTKELLCTSGISKIKNVVTPVPLHTKLSPEEGSLIEDPTLYRSLVGKLNFLTNTRPDLAYTVQNLSQYMQKPRTSHWQSLLLHTLNYLHVTCGQGIKLKAQDKLVLQAYSDSNWGACVDTRRSITGYVMMLGNSPISWKSKKQQTVSMSSFEAEYRVMSSAASEVTWLVRLLSKLDVHIDKPITLYCDSHSTTFIGK